MAVYQRCTECGSPIKQNGRKEWLHVDYMERAYQHTAQPPEVHTFDPEHGRAVSSEDHAELRRRREAQAYADMEVLGPIAHHTNQREQCTWCLGKVFRYGSTPGGERHYCRGCVSSIMSLARGNKRCGEQLPKGVCHLSAGHPGKCRPNQPQPTP